MCFSFLVACSGATPSTVEPPDPWELTWSDEFTGAAGTAPDRTKWVPDVGGSGWGNGQLEFDTDSTENAALDGEGHLVITARREKREDNAYTSARLKTLGRFEQAYGRIEARMQLPSGRGLWPAFWMLGADFEKVGWPTCGEIDIMEYRGQEPSVTHGSLHGPGYSGASPVTGSFRLKDDARFDDSFHTFSVEWDPSRIVFLVDGVAYQTVGAGQVLAKGKWVFDHPFFVILNLAVGGAFLGNPDATTVFPQALVVDYVRAYRRTP